MRAEKKIMSAEVGKSLGASPFCLITDYRGLTVEQFTELRKRLAAVNAEFHVVKNTLLRHALKEAGLPDANGDLTGMTAVVYGRDKAEVSAAAKVVKDYSKEVDKPRVKLGFLGQQILRAEDVAALADLPSLDVLRAKLVGLLQTPATRVAVVLGAPAGQIARVIKAHADKQGGTPAAA
jgi:large subunit ribosomal protein L10